MAAYRLRVHKQVEKFLSGLTPEWRERFWKRLDLLCQDPHHHPLLDIKPMQGLGTSFYRLRIGPYRLIYRVNEQELLIFLMTAGSRGDVYKLGWLS